MTGFKLSINIQLVLKNVYFASCVYVDNGIQKHVSTSRCAVLKLIGVDFFPECQSKSNNNNNNNKKTKQNKKKKKQKKNKKTTTTTTKAEFDFKVSSLIKTKNFEPFEFRFWMLSGEWRHSGISCVSS